MLRFLTAGESHGKCLIGILEGLPAGLPVDFEFINQQLRRRQLGHGRGGRMKIEQDRIEVTSGVRFVHHRKSRFIHDRNKDWDHWRIPMSSVANPGRTEPASCDQARPGHADLPGALKYQTHDARDVLERASARRRRPEWLRAFCRCSCRDSISGLPAMSLRSGANAWETTPMAAGRENIRAQSGIACPLRRSRSRAKNDLPHRRT